MLRRWFVNSYVLALLAILLAFAVQSVVGPSFGRVFAFAPFCFAVMLAARVGAGPALCAMALGYVLAMYYFVNPGSILLESRDAVAGAGIYLLICLSTTLLAESLHRSRRSVEETREELRVTLASIGDAVVVIDAQGRVASVNLAAEQLTGWQEHEARGRDLETVFQVVNETTGQAVENPARRMLHKRTGLGHKDRTVLVSRDGTRTAIEESASPILDAEGETTGVVLIFRDVTEQRRSEDALRASAERLRLVLLEMPMCLTAFDEHGNVIVWNRECERITGFAASEILRNPRALDLLYPDAAYRQQVLNQWQARGDSFRNREWKIANKDGTQRTVAWSNISDRFPVPGWASWGIGVDITERKNAEEILRASEQRFRTMADSAPVMIWMRDSEKNCTWFNRPWLDFTGHTMEQEVGQGWAHGVHPEDVDRCLQTFSRAFTARKSFRMEYRLRRRDSRFRWILDQGIPLYSEGGNFVGYIGSAIDIHEKTEAEEALREADRRKNEFLAMLSHELRNPLATIHYANCISQLPAAVSQDTNYSQMIDDQVKHLVRLIDDLLDVSRIKQNKIELQTRLLDAAGIIRRAIAASRPLIEARKHHLQVEIAEAPMPLLADPTRLEQVVLNLLSNAAKYTPQEGRIEIAARPEGHEIVLVVKDNGVGMPQELLPQVFELFAQGERTLDRSEGGLGIGLTLVRKLVEMHGGTVTAHSEGPGHGSEFTVRLPLAKDVEQAEPNRQPRDFPVAKSPLRILIVEDNIDSAKTMAALLEHAGHKVTQCHNGKDAHGAAKQLNPDVVLLDIGLPGLDGYQVARKIRSDAKLREATIIGLSGYGQDRDRQLSQAAGFDDHLLKPVDYSQLLTLLDGVETSGIGAGS